MCRLTADFLVDVADGFSVGEPGWLAGDFLTHIPIESDFGPLGQGQKTSRSRWPSLLFDDFLLQEFL